MNERHTLFDAMLASIREFSMVRRGEKVLVAVSGGPDSVALLHALWSTREELGIALHVAHLNHSFRGEESDKDAAYVCELAANLGLECTVEKVDVPQIRNALRLSAEEAARMVRYDFLDKVAEEISADRIALGHTADDQVETVLMNLLRGAGLGGLRGMPPVRGKIIRPLIRVRRSEVEDYVETHGLQPRIDVTNLLPTFRRNKIRLELLPLLRREFNPEIDTAILQLAELAGADTAYLDIETEKALDRLVLGREEGPISLDPAGMSDAPVPVRRRLVRRAVRAVRGEVADLGFRHVEELLSLLEAGRDFKLELPARVFVERTREALTFYSGRPSDLPIIYKYELAVPGETSVPEADAVIETDVSTEPVDPVRPPGSMEVVFDFEAITGRLLARNWRPGDRIRPLGLRGSKKLQDVFVDRKIPRRARHRIPVIADDEKIVWVAGLAVSDDAKVTGETRVFLLVRARPI